MRTNDRRDVVGLAPPSGNIGTESDTHTLKRHSMDQYIHRSGTLKTQSCSPAWMDLDQELPGDPSTEATEAPDQHHLSDMPTEARTYFAHQPLLPRLFSIPLDISDIIQRHTIFTKQTAVNDKVSLLAVRAQDGGFAAFGFEI